MLRSVGILSLVSLYDVLWVNGLFTSLEKVFNCHQSLVTGSYRKVLCEVGWLVCLIGLRREGREPWDIILRVRKSWVLYSEYRSPWPEG